MIATAGYSQGIIGSPECTSNIGIYEQYLKAGDTTEAIPSWREAFRICPPGVRQSIYMKGKLIFAYLIEQNKDNPELKSKLIDSLFMMYDLRSQYFPTYNSQIKNYRAIDAINYLEDDGKKLEILQDAIKTCGNTIEPGILVYTMQMITRMYSEGKKEGNDIVNMYSRITPIIDYQIKANQPIAAQAKKDIDLLFANSGVASCENIVKLFKPEFEAHPDDKDLVSRIVRLLNDAQCYKEDLFLKTVEALHRLDPSYKSAEYLYTLYASREDHENALKMLREAIDSPESSDSEDADYLIKLSSYYLQNMKNLIKAAEAAKEAVGKDPAVAGRAYMILGSIWSSVNCGGDEIQQRAKWWVAVDYFMKAKAADSNVASDAQRYIDTYYQYFPLREDAFLFNIVDGDSYTLNCGGLSATTKVRTRLK
jgi:tetratricopeptide (TPR) repeat protein